jgi:hypothetical protein
MSEGYFRSRSELAKALGVFTKLAFRGSSDWPSVRLSVVAAFSSPVEAPESRAAVLVERMTDGRARQRITRGAGRRSIARLFGARQEAYRVSRPLMPMRTEQSHWPPA